MPPRPRHRPVLEELEHRLVLSPPGTGWYPVFEDNFDGNALDPALWRIATGPRRNAVNTANAVSVANGQLTITTYTSGGTHYTGFIDTSSRVLSTYGYWEARIRFQSVSGMWSAFWVHSPTIGNPLFDPATAGTEIDVVEHRARDQGGADLTNRMVSNLHWDGYGQYHRSVGSGLITNPNPPPLQNNFHTYGLLWTPDRYEFFLDGRRVWTTTQAVSRRSEYLLLTSEVQNNSWAGNIPPGGYGSLQTSQAKMIVDWVRVWDRQLYGKDIGSVGRAGSDDLDANGTWVVRGSGSDIWGTADAFRYVYRPLVGDGWVFAQVSWVDWTDPWAKAGVMIRETLNANSKHAMLVVTPQNGAAFQRRVSTGGVTTHTPLHEVEAPYGVLLERVGDDFYAWGTSDYENWELIGAETIPMTTKVHLGLVVTSHNNGLLNTSYFDYVSTSVDPGRGPGGGGRAVPPGPDEGTGPPPVAGELPEGLDVTAMLLSTTVSLITHPVGGDVGRTVGEGAAPGKHLPLELPHLREPGARRTPVQRLNVEPHPLVLAEGNRSQWYEDPVAVDGFDRAHGLACWTSSP